ncbi:hypothetical protein LNP26_31135 [Klebsiella variicola subsp. variicola]|nr:hypothetical protein [Klebsiella variicola subsp. variicola]
MQFDTAAELAALQAQTRRIRQVRYRPSRLDRYTGELLSLYQAGAMQRSCNAGSGPGESRWCCPRIYPLAGKKWLNSPALPARRLA